jgi:iron complex outermembrane receptor protein
MRIKNLLLIGSAMLSVPAVGIAAAGQEDAPAPGAEESAPLPESQAEDEAGLGDIIVTAQRRAENLQDVPIAVTAFGGDQLSTAGVVETSQLPLLVPGVSVRIGTGNFQPFIRGVGTTSSNVENPAALYIDGVYYPFQREGLRELVDLEQIAVLKGPQGTLFGRNATAGVIQITTRTPGRDPKFEFTTGIDNYATWRSNAYVSGGVTENVAANLSASFTTQGNGWGTNVATGNDVYKIYHDLALRSKWVADVTDATRIMMIFDYRNRSDSFTNFRHVPGTRPVYGTVDQSIDLRDVDVGVDGRFKIESGGVSGHVDHDFGAARLVSITSYRKGEGYFSFDGLAVREALLPATQRQPFWDFTQELQLVSQTGGAFTWTAGLFYIHLLNSFQPATQAFRGPAAPAPTSAALQTVYSREEADSLAGFAQGTLEITEATRLTVGLRYTWEKRRFEASRAILLNNGATPPPLVADSSITVKKPNVRIALDHRFSENILGYVSYNTGFKSGGFNLQDPGNPAYEPETLSSYEAGLKMELLDRRMRFNIAGFYYDYKNVLVNRYGAVPLIVNGAAAELYGVDADLEVQATPELRFNAGASLLHAEFTSYPDAQCSEPRPTGGARLFMCSAAGNQIPFSTPLTLTGSVDYEKDLSFGTLNLNVTNSYNDGYYSEPDNNLRVGAHNLLNTSITWTTLDERYSLRLWASNLLDETVPNILYTYGPRAYLQSFGNPPRQYGLTFRYRM